MARTVADVPDWLKVMRAITGTDEEPGGADNPKILAMRDKIAEIFPDMADYCALYQHDDTPWCGLAAAFCMAMAGIRPPYRPPPAPDTDRWLWALAWADDNQFGQLISTPRPGCVVVLERSGGGHVTFYESTSGSSYKCRGGNQSDSVNLASYPIADVVALVWPSAAGPVPPAERRTIQRGDTGADVAEVQRILGIPSDGEFGAVTEAAVEGYQAATGLDVDGVVGPATWAQLDALDASVKAGNDGLSSETVAAITELARNSAIARYQWPGRGLPPDGYIPGMACAFALALTWLNGNADFDGHSAAMVMAKADTHNADKDALAWYRSEFAAEGMSNAVAGADTLRHLFVLLIGLGPRESSGNHWEGRDQSASNTDAMTCESGLFQQSWNSHTASPELPILFDMYWADPNGFLETFDEGLSPTAGQIKDYGSGDGAAFQWLAKYAPAFACMAAAICLRVLRQHFGPINRKEAEIVPEADELLSAVQDLIEEGGGTPTPPEPPVSGALVEIEIEMTGDVAVTVNGKLVS